MDLSPAEREALLAEQCADDPELRQLVAELVGAEAGRTGSFAGPRALAALLAAAEAAARLEPGAEVGPYRIEAELGRGGMGIVYRAYDTRLERSVALKFLTAEAGGRSRGMDQVLAEARALAALDHPNIAALYEIAEGASEGSFLVMPLYGGETLAGRMARGPLPRREALRIARGIARGVAAAHAKGIVHRDLKPGNVMFDEHGEPKVMDFGIARVAARQRSGSPAGAAGTPAYMSPEQSRGEDVDARADVWALGVMLHELLYQRRPVAGGRPSSTGRGRLGRLLTRALAPDPADRFPHAGALLAELERVSRPVQRTTLVIGSTVAGALAVLGVATWPWFPGPPLPDGLAILPFDVAPGDTASGFLARGIEAGLQGDLSALRPFRVIGRASADQYAGSTKPVAQIGQELGVDAVVQGALADSGAGAYELRIRLVQARNGRALWAGVYAVRREELAGFRGRLVHDLTRRLRLEPSAALQDRLARVAALDPRAYEAYLGGMAEFARRSPESLRRSTEQFEHALDIEPGFADAYAQLGLSLALLPQYATLAPEQAMPAARRAAVRALALDPALSAGHTVLATIQETYDLDFAAAEASLTRALESDPDNAGALHTYGLLLCATSRFAEAKQIYARARRADPLSRVIRMGQAFPELYGGEFAQATARLEAVVREFPGFALGRAMLARSYLAEGRYPEALAQMEFPGQPEVMFGYRGFAYAKLGRTREARALADRWAERGNPLNLATIELGLGRRDRALTLLERAVRERSSGVAYLAVREELRELRGDPRFMELLAQLHLPPGPAGPR